MTIAYWCVLVAAFLPYVWVTVAKASGQRYDNREPRAWQAQQDNPRSNRANAAQMNAYEAFAPFAASVLMAQFAGVDPARISMLAIAFVLLRVLHGVFYVAGVHALRSLVWFGGFGVEVGLMVQAALQVARRRGGSRPRREDICLRAVPTRRHAPAKSAYGLGPRARSVDAI
jgi:uncharacterized MAPEG superfamily protein